MIASSLAVVWLVRAQQARIPRIGYLVLPSLSEPPSRERQAFLDGLRELGYVPGRTIEIAYASAENEAEFLEAACADLIKLKVDLIVASGSQAMVTARRATPSIPIVMLAAGDPVAIGLVRSLSRPDANVTGLSYMSSDLAGKRLQLMTDILPKTKRVAVLWDSPAPNSRAEADGAITGARNLGLAPLELPVASERELTAAIRSLEDRKPDALYVVFGSGLIAEHRSVIAAFGLRYGVPIVSGWSSLSEAGGLLSYSPDIPAIYRRAAYYVQRILKGAKPADLPVEQPTKFELVINLKTAKALGIVIPQSVLIRADRVIE